MKRTLLQRFEEKISIEPTSGCWLWTAGVNAMGYGFIGINQRPYLAHRVSWELHNGPIPNNTLVCHHCDNPPCANPNHLFLGTHQDNSDDKYRKNRAVNAQSKLTHCARGHPYSGINLHISPSGYRRCRACDRDHMRISYARNKAAAMVVP